MTPLARKMCSVTNANFIDAGAPERSPAGPGGSSRLALSGPGLWAVAVARGPRIPSGQQRRPDHRRSWHGRARWARVPRAVRATLCEPDCWTRAYTVTFYNLSVTRTPHNADVKVPSV